MDQRTYKLRDFAQDVSVAVKDAQSHHLDKFVGLEHYDSGEPVITRYTDTSLITSSVKEFHKNDILIARRNVYLKRAGIAFFDGLTSGDSIILRIFDDSDKRTGIPKEDAARIIPFVLNSNDFWAYANKHADGMNSKRISKEMLYDYEFSLPSLSEIRQLYSKLWAAYNLKDSYKKLLSATDEMVKSQFIEMFSDVPKVGINTLVDTIWGSSPDSKTYNDTGEGVPFYQGKTEFGDLYINAPVTFCTAPVKMAKANAILMSVRAPVGAVNIATQDCCIGRGLASITPKEGKSTTMFIYFALKYMEEDIDRLGTGSTFKAINKESYAKIQMPNAEISDQTKFVSIAEQADKSKFTSLKSQFIEMFSAMTTTPVKTYVEDSFPGEWGTEDTIGDGVKVIRTTNFTNSGKLNLTDVVTRSIEDRKVSRKQIKKYDTILERSGGTADNPVGRVVLFEEDDLFLCNNFTQVLRFKDIDPRFAFYSLYYFYQTNKTAIRSMGSKTTGIQNLNMSKYLEIGIPNASDEEQKEFVAIAEHADKSKYIN